MQTAQPIQDSLAPLVAQLVLGNQRYEQETHHQRQRQNPHQRVPVVATGHGRLDHVAGTHPGHGDDYARPKRAQVLKKGPGYLWSRCVDGFSRG